jgi:anti-sigma factor RsiW
VNSDASVLELLPAYVADELGVDERAHVERALANSARLRDELARYRHLFVLLAALSLDARDAPAGLDARIMRQVAVQWYLDAAVRWLEGLTGAYGRALLHYWRLG